MRNTLTLLYNVILQRKIALRLQSDCAAQPGVELPVENSYTCYLFSQGLNKILKKLGLVPQILPCFGV